jgi:hypothetical protein
MNAGAMVSSDLIAPMMKADGFSNAPNMVSEKKKPRATVKANVASVRSDISLFEKCQTELLLGTVLMNGTGSEPNIRLNGVPVLEA